MLLFRSEEHVRRWNDRTGSVDGAAMTPNQLWRLAAAWYADCLSPDWRRKTPKEAQEVFEAIGLTGPFWRLDVSSPHPVDTEGA